MRQRLEHPATGSINAPSILNRTKPEQHSAAPACSARRRCDACPCVDLSLRCRREFDPEWGGREYEYEYEYEYEQEQEQEQDSVQRRLFVMVAS